MSFTQTSSRLRIGTRGSALAMWQATTVQKLLQDRWSAYEFELEIIRPEGDLDKHSSLMAIGGRGVFTSALQVQLLDGRIDLAVHSTKDLPSLSPPGVGIAAFPQREDARDALITRHGLPLEELPANPVIGTSSRRRAVQILALRPDARIRELRGNIDTRLRKGKSDEFDAVILASAGLHRMGWEGEITSYMPVDVSCPAPGQGALAVETRVASNPAWEMAVALDDTDVRLEVAVERAFLRGVGGGCTTPIGAHARIERMHGIGTVRFWTMLASDDGTRLERSYEEFALDGAEDQAFQSAVRMLHAVAPKWNGIGDANPLAGLNAAVTGSDSQAEPLMVELREYGATPHRLRTIEIDPVDDDAALRLAVDSAVSGAADWLVLTSPNAVGPLDRARAGRAIATKIAVVGVRTADALREIGVEPAFVSDGPGAVQLVADLVRMGVRGKKVLCLLSDKARSTLVNGLLDAGADLELVTAYVNRPSEGLPEEMRHLVRGGRVDVITFASPSAVESFRRLVGADLPAMSGAGFFAIGPTTAEALHEAGLPVHGVASTQDAAGFIAALQDYFGHSAVREGSITS